MKKDERRRRLRELEREHLIPNGLTHIWGPPGSGKTVLASLLAALKTRHGRVEWVSTDGKMSFVEFLRLNISSARGRVQNVEVLTPWGCQEVRETLLTIRERIDPATVLVVVDSITRALDMSHVEDVMWGRELIEEVMPTLAAISMMGVDMLVVSESRCLDDEIQPVHGGTIRRWASYEMLVERTLGGRVSTVTCMDLQSGAEEWKTEFVVDSEGVVQLTPANTPVFGRCEECSDGHCSG